jgi:predicted enzyme related to lactoylglutathione lyase
VLLVADLDRAVAYYRDRLGFQCDFYGDPPDFATAERDQATILLALCEEPERIVPNWRIVDKIWNAYIRVDDVDAIYVEIQERGAAIDYTIYNAPSGFREFGVQDPDSYLQTLITNRWRSAHLHTREVGGSIPSPRVESTGGCAARTGPEPQDEARFSPRRRRRLSRSYP